MKAYSALLCPSIQDAKQIENLSNTLMISDKLRQETSLSTSGQIDYRSVCRKCQRSKHTGSCFNMTLEKMA